MSDLSFGDGEILEELDEINYLPFSEENNKQVWGMQLIMQLPNLKQEKQSKGSV